MKRTENINLRVTPAEKALIEEKASGAELGTSEWLRLVGTMGTKPRPAVRTPSLAEVQAPGDFEALVIRYQRTMPRRNAEIVARREMRRSA